MNNVTDRSESTVQSRHTFEVDAATPSERETIYRLRHAVYALELRQHNSTADCALRDPLDAGNVYLVARVEGRIAGFVSITLPTQKHFSIDKYFDRAELPFRVDENSYEVRLLTVLESYRTREFATLLMYAAFRWVEAHGGHEIIAIGRQEIVPMYRRAGLRETGLSAKSGSVMYRLLHASVAEIRENLPNFGGLISRLESKVEWKLTFPFHRPAACFHGGAFFSAIGEKFDALYRKHSVINADVLDAWFDPAPAVTNSLKDALPWLLRTSPPTDCSGLIETIAEARGVRPMNILPGAGSSDLMFRALRHWLTPSSRALILDPTYGEYAHVLERVIGCMVDRLPLRRSANYEVDLDHLSAALKDEYDLVALVNPNSPTGRHIQRESVRQIAGMLPAATRLWIDETYIDYIDPAESAETIAAASENVIVCKSMSKVYALSGARAAYLCAGPHQLEALRAITPPWVIGLPTQLAAIRALQSGDYYQARWKETHRLRSQLANGLGQLGWDIVPGGANFLLCHLPEAGPTAQEITLACRAHCLFIRNAEMMGGNFGSRAVRIAVKDAETNAKMIDILHKIVREL